MNAFPATLHVSLLAWHQYVCALGALDGVPQATESSDECRVTTCLLHKHTDSWPISTQVGEWTRGLKCPRPFTWPQLVPQIWIMRPLCLCPNTLKSFSLVYLGKSLRISAILNINGSSLHPPSPELQPSISLRLLNFPNAATRQVNRRLCEAKFEETWC